VRRLKEALAESERMQSERVREMQEAARRECDLMLKKARTQAERIRHAADKESDVRVAALKRVEEVHGLVRAELRMVLAAMLQMLNAPSDVVRESLKNHQLMEDLHRITRATVDASAVAAPDSSVESEIDIDEAVGGDLPAPATSQLAGRISNWTTPAQGE
jgi:cell division septum initiation protein DivIVA